MDTSIEQVLKLVLFVQYRLLLFLKHMWLLPEQLSLH